VPVAGPRLLKAPATREATPRIRNRMPGQVPRRASRRQAPEAPLRTRRLHPPASHSPIPRSVQTPVVPQVDRMGQPRIFPRHAGVHRIRPVRQRGLRRALRRPRDPLRHRSPPTAPRRLRSRPMALRSPASFPMHAADPRAERRTRRRQQMAFIREAMDSAKRSCRNICRTA
jgi:hypothetical protein